ncbi:class I SAM-dependent methyltransferase, partial [candidate division WOR-3 bacterium]|nr:class I SAM-dependent methyltransferase [candidate division WOR-3 bacterium]
MKLPADIEAEILSRASMSGLDYATRSRYARRIRVVREQMMRLSAEFAPGTSCAARYADAYFLSNFPANLMKTMRVINEVLLHCASFPGGRSRVRVLDIGCGEGAGLLGTYYALRSAYPTLEFRLTGIDRSAKMLERGRQMVRSIGGRETRVKVRLLNLDAADVSQAVYDRKCDIVLCVNSLAEIVKEPVLPRDLMSRLYGCVADDGVFVIIEPALKVFSRRLMEL